MYSHFNISVTMLELRTTVCSAIINFPFFRRRKCQIISFRNHLQLEHPGQTIQSFWASKSIVWRFFYCSKTLAGQYRALKLSNNQSGTVYFFMILWSWPAFAWHSIKKQSHFFPCLKQNGTMLSRYNRHPFFCSPLTPTVSEFAR